MKNIWKNHKWLIISAVYVLVMSGFVYFIFLPYVNKIKQKSDSIEEKKLDSQITRSKLEKIPQMEKDFMIFQDNKEAVETIIGQQDVVFFIKRLESLAENTGNKIIITVDESDSSKSKAQKQTKNKEKTIKEELAHSNFISLNINLIGEYKGLVNFINKLENDKYYANIISLDMHKKIEEKSNSNNRTEANIFSSVGKVPKADPEKKTEVLNSNLGVVIYLKN